MKRLLLLLALCAPSPGASADVVQGSVRPESATVTIKDSADTVVATLKAGPFQLWLPAGRFTAECQAPVQKSIAFFSLSVPTSLVVDCA